MFGPASTLIVMTDRPVALLTYADGYVGPALARLLAPTHDLVLHVGQAGAEIEADDLPTEVVTVTAEVDTATGNQMLVDTALERFGRIDAACLITGQIILGPFLEETVERWERVKRANLDMVFHGLQSLLPPMIAAGTGQIVVFTSATGARPEPGVALYGSTRAGANALVRAVGLEHAKDGVCINAIGTNYMDFPGFLKATGADDPNRRAKIEAQVPAGRLGTMEELAEFTTVLLDGRSRFQTGQFFSYSGGWST